jgi:uncharacterized protein
MGIKKINDYYVYVYIDPRNLEEFYFGKGSGTRKDAHLKDKGDSAKAKRIKEIKKQGFDPIIRVIARGLTHAEALLIETTLLWKLGKWTENKSPGQFADKFRPHDTLHKKLSGFDYQKGLYYYNIGEGPHRNWDDYVEFAFISAGQGQRWRDAMLGFNPGDIFTAYLKGKGFVGIGRIKTAAKMIRDVRSIEGIPILDLPLLCKNMRENCVNSELSEYVCLVDWIKTVSRNQAKWTSRPKLYTTTHVRASLDGQPETVSFLEAQFAIQLREMIT